MTLPDGAKIIGVHNSEQGALNNVYNGDGSQALVNVTQGSVYRFELNGNIYNSLYDGRDGTFLGYGKNESTVVVIGDFNSKIVENEWITQAPDTKLAGAVALRVLQAPGLTPPQIRAVAATATAVTIVGLSVIALQTTVHNLQITAPAIVTDGYYYSKELANEKWLENQGINAHELKEEWLGNGDNSKYDIYKNKDTKELEIFRKGGVGEGIKTGIKYIVGQ